MSCGTNIGTEFLGRIKQESSSCARRARLPLEDPERVGAPKDSVKCKGGWPVVASPSMVVCRKSKDIRCRAHSGYRIMTGHQIPVIAPNDLGRPHKPFLQVLRV